MRAQRLKAFHHLLRVLPSVSLLGASLGKEFPNEGRRGLTLWTGSTFTTSAE
jgi:hypothetical protein